MARGKKADLIKAGYTLLEKQRPQDLSIRAVAAAAECTTGAVYRHFKSAEDLLNVASVKFLENYIVELNDLLKNETDPMRLHIEMWRSFAKQAFANVDVFDKMFFGVDEETFNDAVFTYYQEFPENWRKLTGFHAMVYFSSSINERNLLTLQRCMKDYKLTEAEIVLINDFEIMSFRGMLMEYKESYRLPGVPEEALVRYMNVLDYGIDLLKRTADQRPPLSL